MKKQILTAASRRAFLKRLVGTAAVASATTFTRVALGKPKTKAKTAEKVKTVDLNGILPANHVVGAVLMNLDQPYLVFDARQQTKKLDRTGKAVIALDNCLAWHFGATGEENLSPDTVKDGHLDRLETYEVINSTWADKMIAQKGDDPLVGQGLDFYHFVFTFQGTSFECLATDLQPTIHQKSFSELFGSAT